MHPVADVNKVRWWAMRVAYNQSMRVKHELEDLGIEFFLPMKRKIVLRGERRIKVLVPAISNLIFIRSSFERLADYHQQTQLPVRYMIDRTTDKPILVPDSQMRSFIAVAGLPDEQVIYLEPDVPQLTRGQRVRITAGVFKGATGYFVRLKGDRRVVVNIEGIAAVATTFVHPSLIEPLPDEPLQHNNALPS